MEYRYLKPGEERLWFACRRENETPAIFTQNHGFNPLEYPLVKVGNQLAVKARIIINSPYMSLLVDPFIIKSTSKDKIVRCLLNGYYQDFFPKVKSLQILLHHSLPYILDLEKIIADFGFQLTSTKELYSLEQSRLRLPESISPFSFVTLGKVGKKVLLNILHDILSVSLEKVTQTPAITLEMYWDMARKNGEDPLKDWWIALIEKEPVGIIFPHFLDQEKTIGTNLYLGIRPGFRNRGFGKLLQSKCISLLMGKGARTFLGSTSVQNKPMKTIFKSLGYQYSDTQFFFTFPDIIPNSEMPFRFCFRD